MRSKILSVILSICMVLTLTPAMAFAAGDADATISISKVELNPVVTGVEVTTGEAITGTSGPAIVFEGDITEPAEEGVQYTIKVQYSKDSAEATTASGIVVITADADKNLKATDKKDAGEGKVTFTDEKNSAITFVSGVNITKLTIKSETTEPDNPGTTTTEPAIEGTPEKPAVVVTSVPAIDTSGLTGKELDVAETINANLESVKVEVAETSKETLQNNINDSITEEQKTAAVDGLKGLPGNSNVTAEDIVFVAEPSLKIDVGTVNDTSVTWTLNYVYKLIATTANVKVEDLNTSAGSGQNAVYVEEDPKPLNTVNVEIEIKLPVDITKLTFLADTTKAFVKHVKDDGSKYLHEATIEGSSDVKTLTFKNKYGFSEFTAQAKADGLTIGEAWYETLQEAVDAAKSGDTIAIHEDLPADKVEANVSGTKNIKFKLDDGLSDVTLKVGGKDIALTPGVEGSFNNVPSNPGGGGGSSATTYTVTVPSSIDHGKITVSPKNASKGNTVTITATPDEGYKLGTITVKDKDGKEIEVKDAGNGKYTFVMPASKVEISATFVEDDGKPTDPTQPTTPSAVTYSDVAETAWYYDAVKYVTEKGLMNGVGNDRFAPNSNLTRAMFAQILYNKAGKPAAGASTFTDVAAGQWYADAVSWAAAQGVVNGIGNGMFGPNNNITREQLAVMLYRYAGSPAVTGSVTGFNDAGQISSYAKDAMAWATTNGVMNGKGDGRLDPKGLATRAEVAQMMQNYFK